MKVKIGDVVKHSYDKLDSGLEYIVFRQRDDVKIDGDMERYWWIIPVIQELKKHRQVGCKLVGAISAGEYCLYKTSIEQAFDRPNKFNA